MAARGFEQRLGRRGVWVALLLGLGCSSSRGAPPAAPDAAIDAAPPDVAPDARGGTTGTSRGRDAGLRPDLRGGGGSPGTGGSSGSGGSAGSGPSADAAVPRDSALPSTVANDTCQTAQAFALDKPRVDLAASNRGAGHHLDLPCAKGGADVFFSFTLNDRELIYADTFGAAFDTILAFRESCDAAAGGPEPSCQDDACGGKQSQAVAVLGPGKHYLVLSGGGDASGDVTVHLEHAPVGAGPVAALGIGTATVSGTTSGAGRLALCEAGGPENSHWWTSCQGFAGGLFKASTCSDTSYDTILSLQIPRTAAVVCNDDACRLQAAISTNLPPGPGLHVLSVDGFTPRHKGPYTLTTTRP